MEEDIKLGRTNDRLTLTLTVTLFLVLVLVLVLVLALGQALVLAPTQCTLKLIPKSAGLQTRP